MRVARITGDYLIPRFYHGMAASSVAMLDAAVKLLREYRFKFLSFEVGFGGPGSLLDSPSELAFFEYGWVALRELIAFGRIRRGGIGHSCALPRGWIVASSLQSRISISADHWCMGDKYWDLRVGSIEDPCRSTAFKLYMSPELRFLGRGSERESGIPLVE